jgi:enoyl-CoA hydratase/carnithine racemase
MSTMPSTAEKRPRVGLFATCLVDLYRPSIGFAAARLIEMAGCDVDVPLQTCCGQPAYNSGDKETAKTLARQAISTLEPYDYVVIPSGSCGGMLKSHYPKLLADDPTWGPRATTLSARVHELVQFLTDVRKLASVDARFDGKATYHDSCSGLRELNIKDQPRQLLKSVKGLSLVEMEDSEVCCGFGGTFSIKYPDVSNAMVQKKVDHVGGASPDVLQHGRQVEAPGLIHPSPPRRRNPCGRTCCPRHRRGRVTIAATGAAMTAAPPLLVEAQGPTLLVTLDRPQQRNPLSDAMIAALTAAIDQASRDDAVRAVVIAANGPAFSAGHDLKEMTAHRQDADRGRAYFHDLMTRCAAMMQAIVTCPKPVIAAVQGVASAAGCQLVASCDLAVASETARFSTPGVNIGLFCSTPMVALSRNVARKHAMEMLLLGEMIDAAKAQEIGLINRVVPSGTERAEALQIAALIATKSPLTVKIGKEAFYRQIEMSLAEAYAYTAQVMAENMLSRDAAEGIGAFIEKRPPSWTGS